MSSVETGGRGFAAKFSPVAVPCDFPSEGDEGPPVEWAEGMPRGGRRFWGIPFRLATEAELAHVLRLSKGEAARIAVGGVRATHLCFLHYWEGEVDWREGDAGGGLVAEYELRYADGGTHTAPVRTRYEIGWGPVSWGRHLYNAVSFSEQRSLDFMSGKLEKGHSWGGSQTDSDGPGLAGPWIFALTNPRPAEPVEAVELRGTDAAAVGIVGLTLYDGPGHPLRHNPRRYFSLELPEGAEVASMDVDLGVIVRDAGAAVPRDEAWLSGTNGRPDDSAWLEAIGAGLGVPAGEGEKADVRLFEASAADGATLTVKLKRGEDEKTVRLSLGEAFHGGASEAWLSGPNSGPDDAADRVRVRVSHPKRTWVHVTVRDEETGKPVPARVHFSGPGGEYYAPHGHHTVVNDNWFEDYGADIKLGGMSYAYVDGTFATNLPVGDLYVEAAKGFEYEPLRKRIEIAPGQKELELAIRRKVDLSKEGWVTADTHVHFISPHTAWLQGQCEGVNLINLLASQWGRLFTNAGDITGEVGVEKGGTIVWVGTENRNHILGHISMLGTRGEPVYPMCCGGPGESYIGDPDERALAEWADECRRKQGLVVRPHFPSPNLENPADIVLGKFDALEIRPGGAEVAGPLDEHAVCEYYRYLNCGYRIAAVGGTDKMSASMPVGASRTYARLERDRPFDFESWAEAVRAGRTYTTSGPLMDLTVDGHGVGEEIRLTGGGGTVEVHAAAECMWPMHRLEIVMNGKVVGDAFEAKGARRLEVRTKVKVDGSSWIAARAASSYKIVHGWAGNLAAHTSPVYIVVPGTELFSPSDATYMLTLIDGGLTYLDTLSVRYDDERHNAIKAIYRAAQTELHERMHANGGAHGHEH